MMLRKLICATIFLQILVSSNADDVGGSAKPSINRPSIGSGCSTSDQRNGTCILLGDCIYANSLADRERINYILGGLCDGSTGGRIIMCCPNERNQSSIQHPIHPSIVTTPEPGGMILPNDRRPSSRKVNIESESKSNPNTFPASSSKIRDSQGLIECKPRLENRIVGGEVTKLDEFPWVALLLYKYSDGPRLFPSCGGVILTKRWILTAAHCVKGARLTNAQMELRKIRVGEYDLRNETDCITDHFGERICKSYQEFDYVKTISHENYNSSSLRSQRYDVALVKLSGTITFTDHIQAICLPPGPVNPSEEFYAVGWGTTENYRRSDVKLSVKLSWFDLDRCKSIYYTPGLGFGQFCAGGRAGEDTCRGDSGGPLVTPVKYGNKIDYWKLVGIISFGYKHCGTEDKPGIYTSVWDHMPWIRYKIQNN